MTMDTSPHCDKCGRPLWHHAYPQGTCPPESLVVTAPLEKLSERERGVANPTRSTNTYGFGRADANNQGGEDYFRVGGTA